MSANFTPNLNPIKLLPPFKWFVQSALPLVYDDSLSYYEVLTKLTRYVNECIGDMKIMIDNDMKIVDSFVDLQNYVNEYFDNIDISASVNEVVNELIDEGKLNVFVNQGVLNDTSTDNITELSDGYRDFSFTRNRRVTGLPADFPELSSGTIVSMNNRHIIFGGKSAQIGATNIGIVPFIYSYQKSNNTWYLIYNGDSILKMQGSISEYTTLSSLDAGMYYINTDNVLDSIPADYDTDSNGFLVVYTFAQSDTPYFIRNKVYYLTQYTGKCWVKFNSDDWISYNELNKNLITTTLNNEANGYFVNRGSLFGTVRFQDLAVGFYSMEAGAVSSNSLPDNYNNEMNALVEIFKVVNDGPVESTFQYILQSNGLRYVRIDDGKWRNEQSIVHRNLTPFLFPGDNNTRIKAACDYMSARGECTLDLCGLEWPITTTLIINNLRNSKIINGTIIAASSFTGDYVVEFRGDNTKYPTSGGGYQFADMILDGVTIDGNKKAGCINYYSAYLRNIYNNCILRQFTTFAFHVNNDSSLDGHELLFNNVYIYGRYPGDTSGTLGECGIYLNKHDNQFNNLVIYNCDTSIELHSGANYFVNCHLYSRAALKNYHYDNKFIGCYFDGSPIYLNGPWKISFESCTFAADTNFPNDYFIDFHNTGGWYMDDVHITNSIYVKYKDIPLYGFSGSRPYQIGKNNLIQCGGAISNSLNNWAYSATIDIPGKIKIFTDTGKITGVQKYGNNVGAISTYPHKFAIIDRGDLTYGITFTFDDYNPEGSYSSNVQMDYNCITLKEVKNNDGGSGWTGLYLPFIKKGTYYYTARGTSGTMILLEVTDTLSDAVGKDYYGTVLKSANNDTQNGTITIADNTQNCLLLLYDVGAYTFDAYLNASDSPPLSVMPTA